MNRLPLIIIGALFGGLTAALAFPQKKEKPPVPSNVIPMNPQTPAEPVKEGA